MSENVRKLHKLSRLRFDCDSVTTCQNKIDVAIDLHGCMDVTSKQDPPASGILVSLPKSCSSSSTTNSLKPSLLSQASKRTHPPLVVVVVGMGSTTRHRTDRSAAAHRSQHVCHESLAHVHSSGATAAAANSAESSSRVLRIRRSADAPLLTANNSDSHAPQFLLRRPDPPT